jgi:hypothetical protein
MIALKEACAGNAELLKEALSTVEYRLMPMLERAADDELDKYYVHNNQP